MALHLWFALLFAAFASAQTCENYGITNGSSCACPPGFGGPTCSQLGCGGNIFQGSQRPLTSTSSSSSFANLTSSNCGCQDGWTGTGCNVCQTSNACQAAFNAVQPQPNTPSTDPGAMDNSLTCNNQALVYAASQMSCRVINPTLQVLFPGSTTLNILRTLDPSLTPIANVTSFGGSGSISAQLFYDDVEQFYCKADSCTQELNAVGTGSAKWECSNLECTCRPGTTFCGAVPASDLTNTINKLGGTLGIGCGAVDSSSNTAACNFTQVDLQDLFGSQGLPLDGCTFGECVRQSVIDVGANNTAPVDTGSKSLSGGVIAGLAVVGALVLLLLSTFFFGLYSQKKARKTAFFDDSVQTIVKWVDLSYVIPSTKSKGSLFGRKNSRNPTAVSSDKTILDSVSGEVKPGQMMAILGPSGAGKTTLVEILSGRNKCGTITGTYSLILKDQENARPPRIGFVPQQDILPSMLTVYETLLFAARLRLPESVSEKEKQERVETLLDKLGIKGIRDTRIGSTTGEKARGISGGEMRRVSIGLELIANPDVLLLDEPTSGLDSVSASRVANVLYDLAHDPVRPIPIIASIHQPSSQLYHKFDTVLVLAHGRAIYSGAGGIAPTQYFSSNWSGTVPAYQQGYNVAEYLLEIASDPPVNLFQTQLSHTGSTLEDVEPPTNTSQDAELGEKTNASQDIELGEKTTSIRKERTVAPTYTPPTFAKSSPLGKSGYATTFLTQFQHLCGREWKILKRDRTLFLTHVIVSAILGVFCGGLYFNTGITIAGFQSRVGCLFFLGALLAFSSLSALYNIVEIRPLFLRERSSSFYSPTAWLLSRFFFDMIPLRLVPTIIVSTITYWMAGLAPTAENFFKFLLILVLYSVAMTLFNFLLGTLFQNGGVAILLSALSALYQMTFAGFFVHLADIPPVLRWLQWICPLKYTLEALSVNEVDSGLMIVDTLQGVPVNVSAALIMNILFGFGANNYYRDVLILMGFIIAFAIGVISVIWVVVRERR